MVRRDVTKGHGRPQGDAATRVVAAHHAGEVVASSVQAVNGLALGVEHLGVVVASQTCEGAQTARYHAHGIERTVLDGCHAGVATGVGGVALHAVVGGLAFGKFAVVANVGLGVVTRHGVLQGHGIDAAHMRQLGQGVAALHIAIGQHAVQGHGRGLDCA